MANADSGINSASRFFNYRWAYITLAGLLWFNLILMMSATDQVALFAPTYLVWNVLSGQIPDVAELSVQGVLGFDFGYGAPAGAAFVSILFVALFVACFIVPESGETKRLPAMRGMHLRAKITAAFMVGIAVVALMVGLLDALNIDMLGVFQTLGWMQARNLQGFIYVPDSFEPESGMISMISLGSLIAGIVSAGLASFGFMSLTKLGRDRYWQIERWTLFITLSGVVLILLSIPFIEQDNYIYRRHYVYLGGCYTSWIIGWILLTFAWTCRTILLMMMQVYEKASLESDEPNGFACGYDLRMLTSHQCPECGTVITEKRMKKIKRRTERSMAAAHAESRSTTR